MMEVVVFHNVYKNYGNVVALRGVSFAVKRGSIHALLGHNGAGKTTSIRLMLGLLKPSYGTIRVFDSNPFEDPKIRAQIGYVGEYIGLYRELSVHDNLLRFCTLKLGSRELCRSEVRELIERFELDDIIKAKVDTLSAGNKKRVAIARAFIGEPQLLVLDEPFNNLDPVWRARLKNILVKYVRDQGASIVFSSHVLSDVEDIASDVTILYKGRVVYTGSLRGLLERYGRKKLIIQVKLSDSQVLNVLKEKNFKVIYKDDFLIVNIRNEEDIDRILELLQQYGCKIRYITVEKMKLEDIYVRIYSAESEK